MSHEDSAIPLPWVARLAKLNRKGRGKGGEVAAATEHVWWLTYANKSEKRSKGTVVKLAMIKVIPELLLTSNITQKPCSLPGLRREGTITATHAVDAF